MKKQHYKFRPFKLPYAYGALEPYIDAETVKLHYENHLTAYTDKLNSTLAPYPEFHNWSLEKLLCNINNLPVKIRNDVKIGGGGVYNHIYFFAGMVSGGKTRPEGLLGDRIGRIFGGWDKFKEKFKAAALDVFGSGYAWLVSDRRGALRIIRSENQDSPVSRGLLPIMVIDVWEHAYYLKHRSDRAAYVDSWFGALNIEFAEENYDFIK